MVDEKFELGQICVVVKNLDEAVKYYWKILGIGPWSIYTAKPPELRDTKVRGKDVEFSMKLAFARVGSIILELIQPLEGESIFKEFLDKKGGGLHHIATYKVDDLDKTVAQFKEQGIDVLQTVKWRGASVVHLDTEEKLGVIIELIKRTTELPPPEATYP